MTGTMQKPPSLEAAAVSAEGKTFASSLPQERMGVMREDEIRARLDAATPGPWYMSDEYGMVDWNSHYVDSERDVEFIANAPADIDYLLEQLDIIKSDNADLRKLYRAEVEECQRMQQASYGLVQDFERLLDRVNQAADWNDGHAQDTVISDTLTIAFGAGSAGLIEFRQALQATEATPCTPS